jgi:hypothetical protein
VVRRQTARPAQSIPRSSAAIAVSDPAASIEVTFHPEESPAEAGEVDNRLSGKLWDPLIGLSEREVEEWEQQGKRRTYLTLFTILTIEYRKSCPVASFTSRNDALDRRI